MSDGALFEPDVLITDQLVAASRRRSALSNEKRLMLAVLENGLDYYRRYIRATDRAGRTLHTEAAEWIASTNRDDIFAFESICEALDINPDYLRRGIVSWRARLLSADDSNTSVDSIEPVRAAG